MKTILRSGMPLVIVACVIILAAVKVRGMGSDYSTNDVSNPAWPKGMAELANVTNRVGGLWVNAEDVFFFSGKAVDFNAFLDRYSTVQPIKKHRLILQEGVGEAFSLGGGNRRPCDWELDGSPAAWRDLHQETGSQPRDTNYVLEVRFWTGGTIALQQVVIPKNVEVVKPK